ncbi:hypothetical protein KNT64_gp023 [Pseudomonas phage PspYZU05]|uniref:Uncharacterized protein n=1 Tax=Pseudomonas phage PspYZU05 TaxID=1983556 RepID=A0A2U7N2G5_9CAUD|nr:hypothetical protein KNT64_gp023 [Pseudomonas phage PspYZU05]ASD51975.1 hypothetical protein PspYZU05_23 [Pseudomonas phage PspYZU05]
MVHKIESPRSVTLSGYNYKTFVVDRVKDNTLFVLGTDIELKVTHPFDPTMYDLIGYKISEVEKINAEYYAKQYNEYKTKIGESVMANFNVSQVIGGTLKTSTKAHIGIMGKLEAVTTTGYNMIFTIKTARYTVIVKDPVLW